MFTGIITATGVVKNIKKFTNQTDKEAEFCVEISPPSKQFSDIKKGDSISCSGCCLTVSAQPILTDKTQQFTFYAISETLRVSNLDYITENLPINLERSLKMEDSLDGHIVYGHIDETGIVKSISHQVNGTSIAIETSKENENLLVPKDSISIDGISLTISSTKDNLFIVNIIPETKKKTTIQTWKEGQKVNIEFNNNLKQIRAMVKYYSQTS